MVRRALRKARIPCSTGHFGCLLATNKFPPSWREFFTQVVAWEPILRLSGHAKVYRLKKSRFSFQSKLTTIFDYNNWPEGCTNHHSLQAVFEGRRFVICIKTRSVSLGTKRRYFFVWKHKIPLIVDDMSCLFCIVSRNHPFVSYQQFREMAPALHACWRFGPDSEFRFSDFFGKSIRKIIGPIHLLDDLIWERIGKVMTTYIHSQWGGIESTSHASTNACKKSRLVSYYGLRLTTQNNRNNIGSKTNHPRSIPQVSSIEQSSRQSVVDKPFSA